MSIEILFSLSLMASFISGATFGYCLRAQMEGATAEAERNSELWMRSQAGTPIPSGDIDDRLKDFSDEYRGIKKPVLKEEGSSVKIPKREFLSPPQKPKPPRPRLIDELTGKEREMKK